MNEKLGVVYWNTLYRADPAAQMSHIYSLEQQLQTSGASSVLLCLSEVTRAADRDCLWNRLDEAGYRTGYRATSNLGWAEEGLCIASRTDQFEPPMFAELRTARAIANIKTRWLGHVMFAGVSVFTTHASYPFPSKQERQIILEKIEADRWANDGTAAQLIGGDFNTLMRKRHLYKQMEAMGMVKLQANNGRWPKHTVPSGRISVTGPELDHAFVDIHHASRTHMQLGPKGPSNHKPLLVTVQN